MNVSKAKPKTSYHCAFQGCTNNSRFTPPEITFHAFAKPCVKVLRGKEEATQSHIKECLTCTRCDRWISAGQGTKKWPKSIAQIKSSHYVCSLHFVRGHPYSDQFPDPLSVTDVIAVKNKRKTLLENIHAAKRNVLPEGPIPKFSDPANCPSETVDISYNCSKCSYHTASNLQLHHHFQTKHNKAYTAELFHAVVEPEQFSCISCDYRSYYRFELYEHFIQAHDPRTVTNESGPLGELENYICDYCRRYQSHSILTLTKHRELCKEMPSTRHGSNEKINQWNQCSYQAKQKSHSQRHLLQLATNRLQCSHCSYRTSYRTKYKSHLRRHKLQHAKEEKIYWFRCSYCSYRAKQKPLLQSHMLDKHAATTSDKIIWFQCSNCSYRAKYKSQLLNHMVKHATDDEIDWFQCTECSHRSKQKFNLRKHVLIHHTAADEVDWFQCNNCSYRTKQKSCLQSHVLKHATIDEIDWFQCSHCSYRGKHELYLRTHMLRRHAANEEIRWFRCNHCSYRAKQKAHLQSHMLNHATDDEINWFQCNKCSYRAKRKSTFRRHCLVRHAADEEI